MTKLESRSMPNTPWEYQFYVDIEGNVDDPRVAAALEGIGRNARYLRVLGCYPRKADPSLEVPKDVDLLLAARRGGAGRRRRAPVAPTRAGSPTRSPRAAGRRSPARDAGEGGRRRLRRRVRRRRRPVRRRERGSRSSRRRASSAREAAASSAAASSSRGRAPTRSRGSGWRASTSSARAGLEYHLPDRHRGDGPRGRRARRRARRHAPGRGAEHAELRAPQGGGAEQAAGPPQARDDVVGGGAAPRGRVHPLGREPRTSSSASAASGPSRPRRGTRSTSGAVPVLKARTHLPVIVDPSHAMGVTAFVAPMARAALAAGADGVIVEVHPRPAEALCDGPQALTPDLFAAMMGDLRRMAQALGVKMCVRSPGPLGGVRAPAESGGPGRGGYNERFGPRSVRAARRTRNVPEAPLRRNRLARLPEEPRRHRGDARLPAARGAHARRPRLLPRRHRQHLRLHRPGQGGVGERRPRAGAAEGGGRDRPGRRRGVHGPEVRRRARGRDPRGGPLHRSRRAGEGAGRGARPPVAPAIHRPSRSPRASTTTSRRAS